MDEMKDFADVVKVVEGTLNRAFSFNIMNYLMLMMVDHQVHYHAIPRFNGPRTYEGLEWLDNGWPGLPVMSDAQHSDQERLLLIVRDHLRTNIN